MGILNNRFENEEPSKLRAEEACNPHHYKHCFDLSRNFLHLGRATVYEEFNTSDVAAIV
jgi:hypothetical protein